MLPAFGREARQTLGSDIDGLAMGWSASEAALLCPSALPSVAATGPRNSGTRWFIRGPVRWLGAMLQAWIDNDGAIGCGEGRSGTAWLSVTGHLVAQCYTRWFAAAGVVRILAVSRGRARHVLRFWSGTAQPALHAFLSCRGTRFSAQPRGTCGTASAHGFQRAPLTSGKLHISTRGGTMSSLLARAATMAFSG